MKLSFVYCLGLLILIAPDRLAVAQTALLPASNVRRFTFQVERMPITTALGMFFKGADAKYKIDPALKAQLSIHVVDVSFNDAFRAFMDGAAQPFRYTYKNGTYFVTAWPQSKNGSVANQVGIVDLPPDVALTSLKESIFDQSEPLPFIYKTSDGCFQEEASQATSLFGGVPIKVGSIPIRGDYFMGGTVVIKPLAPNKIISVSNGGTFSTSDGIENNILNLSPLHPVLFDTSSETIETKHGIVRITDKRGHSVTIYPYFSETTEPFTLALYPHHLLSLEDVKAEKLVHQGTDPEIIWITGIRWPTLTVYLPDKKKATGAAVVICPGGGYAGEAMDLEGYDVAKRFAASGVAGIVLKYRLPAPDMDRAQTPWPLQDGLQAIRLVRDHATDWHLDPHKVGIMGFSAGGHLASSVATHFDNGDAHSPDRTARLSSRPDFLILGYPVITFHGPYAHTGSRDNLLGTNADPKLVTLYSNDEQVTAQTPPTFLVHAQDDPVSVQNSVLFSEALKRHKVSYEFLHLQTGGHGFGLGVHGGEPAQWPERCLAWLQAQKLL